MVVKAVVSVHVARREESDSVSVVRAMAESAQRFQRLIRDVSDCWWRNQTRVMQVSEAA